MHKSDVVRATIRIGSGVLSIRRKGNSELSTARILGFELSEDGVTGSVWLDRLVHTLSESAIGSEDEQWSLSGAFVSVMSKRLSVEELAALKTMDGEDKVQRSASPSGSSRENMAS